MAERTPYDEFAYFADNASEAGIAYDRPPVVRRVGVEVAGARRLSALVWGAAAPDAVLLHGGAPNAHTFDTVALALGRPLVAVDLPGHGHSDGADGRAAGVEGLAADLAVAVRSLAPQAGAVVGMSLRGLIAIALAGVAPDLVRALVLVDITPGVTAAKAAAITAFVWGPATFPSFEELLERTMQFNPTRSEGSLRRGILHNAEEQGDGAWRWRHRRSDGSPLADPADHGHLWGLLGRLDLPVVLVRGLRQGSVVDDDDEDRLLATARHGSVVRLDAGHSVQGDDPIGLARVIAEVLGG